MAQNNKTSVSLSNPIEIMNKAQSMDSAYGVYDNETDALVSMEKYGLDGRLVAVYADKINGYCRLYKYNKVHKQLDPIEFEGVFDDTGDMNFNIELNAAYPYAKPGFVVVDTDREVEFQMITKGKWVKRKSETLLDERIIPEIVSVEFQSYK